MKPGSEDAEEEEANGISIHNEEDTVDLTYEEFELRELRKREVLCYSQIAVLFLIVAVCVINLSLRNGDQTAWTAMLATALGIFLPQPGIDKRLQTGRYRGERKRKNAH